MHVQLHDRHRHGQPAALSPPFHDPNFLLFLVPPSLPCSSFSVSFAFPHCRSTILASGGLSLSPPFQYLRSQVGDLSPLPTKGLSDPSDIGKLLIGVGHRVLLHGKANEAPLRRLHARACAVSARTPRPLRARALRGTNAVRFNLVSLIKASSQKRSQKAPRLDLHRTPRPLRARALCHPMCPRRGRRLRSCWLWLWWWLRRRRRHRRWKRRASRSWWKYLGTICRWVE
jgi:hypothetical protein